MLFRSEATPRQTSSDYRLRGNCHFPRPFPGTSGGQIICADLNAGNGSYLDFVVEVSTSGTYSLGATLAVGGSCSVFVDDVENNAAQADTGYSMTSVGTISATSDKPEDIAIGTITFDRPGLKIIRIQSNVRKQQLKIDRIQLGKKSS